MGQSKKKSRNESNESVALSIGELRKYNYIRGNNFYTTLTSWPKKLINVLNYRSLSRCLFVNSNITSC
ncbi:Hypothetical predicted protein [Octopus vulgaris]|uniref:Uncharacterized protein n=1 Tax=Octopus vulgaris TaxID=6645 RepID=A0AA36C1E8_OCTVU|nr:Hypothetical predicted protein [Octopus vulgaris]